MLRKLILGFKRLLNDERGSWLPALGTLVGGVAGWFGAKKRAKALQPTLEPIKYGGIRPADIGTFPSYQSARGLLGGIGTPESYRNIYYRDIFQPTAAARRRQFETRELPQIESMLGRMNIASTPQAAGLLMQRRGDIESELSTMMGQLKAAGYETGLGERARQLGGYQQLTGQERAQQQQQAQFGWQEYLNKLQQRGLQFGQEQAYGQAQADIIPSILTGAVGGVDIGRGIGSGISELFRRKPRPRYPWETTPDWYNMSLRGILR